MKTLDEVIKAFEICIGYYCSNSEHDVCPYLGESDMGCGKEPEKDALHYLKAFRDAKDTLEREKDRYAEAVRNCEEAENKYKALELGYIRATADLEDNPPLTWEELRTMTGKPVWVESSDSFNRRRWMFVGEWFDDDKMRLFDMGYEYPDYVSKNGYESGTWQAYRKERE